MHWVRRERGQHSRLYRKQNNRESLGIVYGEASYWFGDLAPYSWSRSRCLESSLLPRLMELRMRGQQ